MLHHAMISVVIPAYNHASWVATAIQSVFAQTHTDWEMIIIDDASSDATWQVIQGFSDARIRAWQHEYNQGAASTLNEALAAAKGDYIAILNSDDSWHPTRLARCLSIALEQDASFVATSAHIQYSYQTTPVRQQEAFAVWYQNLQSELQSNSSFLTTLVRGNILLTTSNFFFNRSIYEQLGGFTELRYVHDYDFALRVCEAGLAIVYSPEVLLSYRQHDHNTIHEDTTRAIQENLALLYQWLPRLQSHLTTQGWKNFVQHLNDLQTLLHGEWCARLHNALVAKENSLFPLITERDHWIQERDYWIQERDHRIQEQSRWIQERDRWITERDESLSLQAQWVADRDAWITARDQTIARLESQLQQLHHSKAYRLGNTLLKPLRFLRQTQALVRQYYA